MIEIRMNDIVGPTMLLTHDNIVQALFRLQLCVIFTCLCSNHCCLNYRNFVYKFVLTGECVLSLKSHIFDSQQPFGANLTHGGKKTGEIE